MPWGLIFEFSDALCNLTAVAGSVVADGGVADALPTNPLPTASTATHCATELQATPVSE